jgi:hypothetical protein
MSSKLTSKSSGIFLDRGQLIQTRADPDVLGRTLGT